MMGLEVWSVKIMMWRLVPSECRSRELTKVSRLAATEAWLPVSPLMTAVTRRWMSPSSVCCTLCNGTSSLLNILSRASPVTSHCAAVNKEDNITVM